MLEGGAHAARRIYFKPCVSWWYERFLRGFNKQIRGFFFRKVHHGGQPNWVRFILLQNHWHGQTTEITQRCREAVICLTSPKYLMAEFRPDLGCHKRHLCPRSMESTVCLNGILASLVISQSQLCTPGSEGLPWILSGCTTQGHRVGLNWAVECFLFGQHRDYFNLLPKKMCNAERTVS